MHKILSFSIFLSGFFLLAQLTGDEYKKVTIMQTGDIHSHIFGETNSWAKLASVIQREREGAGKNNFLLIDCGDTLTGTAIGAVSRGKAGAIMLNKLGYDVWVPGNHDFELGENDLSAVCRYLKPDILAGNLEWGKDYVKPWQIYIRNGARIAVIGLTSPHLKDWLWGKEMGRFEVSDLETALEKIMPSVMASSPHMMILAVHHGRYPPKRLNGVDLVSVARKFPQIDLILGAHSHEEVPGEKIANSWVVASGALGSKLARIEALIDIDGSMPVKLSSKLIPVEKEAAGIDCDRMIKQFQVKTDEFNNRVIGKTKSIISVNDDFRQYSAMHELFGKAMMATADSAGAVGGIFDETAFFSGNITSRDLFKAVPFDDTIGILYLRENEMIAIADEQMQIKDIFFQALHGIRIKRGAADKPAQILTLTNGESWDEKQRYPVAFSSYALAGAGGRFPILKKIALQDECRGQNTGILLRDAVLKYISQNSPLEMGQWRSK